MKDKRVAFVREVLESLVDSMDAVLRLSRWPDSEAVPDALRLSASQLQARLGAANRVTTDRFVGAPTVTKSVNEMTTALRHLDAAYIDYRKSLAGSPEQREEGAGALEACIAEVRAEASLWS